MGNTVIVVEHDRETMENSDYMIDLGPGAGEHGGEICLAGETKKLIESKDGINSLTLEYLSYRKQIPIPLERKKGNGTNLILKGASGQILKT